MKKSEIEATVDRVRFNVRDNLAKQLSEQTIENMIELERALIVVDDTDRLLERLRHLDPRLIVLGEYVFDHDRNILPEEGMDIEGDDAEVEEEILNPDAVAVEEETTTSASGVGEEEDTEEA